ncbi:MAG: hypothetical protein V3T17_11720 [Pseudomonadales bacterium]
MKIEIDQQTQSHLEDIAASGNVSPEAIAAQILTQQTEDPIQVRYWRERAEDMAAIQRYKETGECITQEAMNTKMNGMIKEAQTLTQNLD